MNYQRTGFDKKDARNLRVIHTENLSGALHHSISEAL